MVVLQSDSVNVRTVLHIPVRILFMRVPVYANYTLLAILYLTLSYVTVLYRNHALKLLSCFYVYQIDYILLKCSGTLLMRNACPARSNSALSSSTKMRRLSSSWSPVPRNQTGSLCSYITHS